MNNFTYNPPVKKKKIDNLTLDAAKLFQPKDRVRVMSGFFQGEIGSVVASHLTIEVKLDHIPRNLYFNWKELGIVPRKVKGYI